MKAVFIAPSHRQAVYWARQWGYKDRDVIICTPDRYTYLFGWARPDIPAYICGTQGPTNEIWERLEIAGFRVYDAQSLTGEETPVALLP